MIKNYVFTALVILSMASNQDSTAQGFNMALQMGGPGRDVGNFVATDNSGNIYVVGIFGGVGDFDPGSGAVNLSANSYQDIFILKLDPAGSLIWAKQIGGNATEAVTEFLLDDSGNMYLTGHFEDTVDFDPGPGAFIMSSSGALLQDGFILKLDTAANFIWAKQFGAVNSDVCEAMTFDASGNIFLTGSFMGNVDFDPGPGTFNINTNSTNYDLFIVKLDTAGNFIMAKCFTGTGHVHAAGIVVNSDNEIFATGTFDNTIDFNPGVTSFNLISTGNTDIFISKLDSAGDFISAFKCGGTGYDLPRNLILTANEDLCITGWFPGTMNFLGTSLTSVSSDDMFIARINSSCSLLWIDQIGGSNSQRPFAIAEDSNYNLFITGFYGGTTDFDPSAAVYSLPTAGLMDIYIMALNGVGTLLFAQSLGSTSGDEGDDIAFDQAGNMYVTGGFRGVVDFDPGTGTFNLTSYPSTQDVFLLKLINATGIPESDHGVNSISVFPSPASDKVNISGFKMFGEEVTLKVFDSFGRNVSEVLVNTEKFTLNVSGFSKGLYFVQINRGNEVYSGRFVK